jgi:hypothetical protein
LLKNQDILMALKIASIELAVHDDAIGELGQSSPLPDGWRGWEYHPDELEHHQISLKLARIAAKEPRGWTYADLSQSLHLSASECNAAVKRALTCRLLRKSPRIVPTFQE